MSGGSIIYVNKNGDTALSLAAKDIFKKICNLWTNKEDNLANKIEEEKKQEEQRQSLELEQKTSVTDENKPIEIKDLSKEITNQDTTQANLMALEEEIYGLLTKMIDKLEKAGTTNTNIIQNNIFNKIQKVDKTKINLQNIANRLQSIINSNKVTEKIFGDLEDEIEDMIPQQIKIGDLTRIEQLNIFKQIVTKVITNLENDDTITASHKVVMQNSINEIISGIPRLINV